MQLFKQLPLSYKGQLHAVKLIQFSIDPVELQGRIPDGIKPLLIDGRAMISIVNVQLKKMHPTCVPASTGFSYQHVAFRLLIDDGHLHADGQPRGIFFLQSFTNRPFLIWSGNLMTNYQLSAAQIRDVEYLFDLEAEKRHIHYALEDQMPTQTSPRLKQIIGRIDRAYASNRGELKCTQVLRKEWPIEWTTCYHFETTFFKTAQFEGAFRIRKPIAYQWLAPQTIKI